ncbi:hypothetical protein DRJ54_07615 [Candidatus Acetothermia bacterium]|nr:MAG: hypothetical protein DRJ54_07615 [Candidatus Acetothermia bacterium]
MKLFLLAAALAGAVWAGGRPQLEPLPFDSAARAVGEVARALGGGGQGLLEPYPQLAAPFLRLLRHLPRGWRLAVVRWGMSFSLGYPSTAFSSWDPEEPFAHYVARYPPRTYDAVVLGSPSGGTAHLAALLGAPLLPPCYLLGARHRIDSDDMDAYISTARAALQGMERDEGVEAIVHYDPLHDRDLVANAALFRIRALDLPEAYREFIERHLRPGGTIVIAEDTYAWPQIALDDGIWFQIGGLGDVPPEEYLRRYPVGGEPASRRESEWGSPEAFVSAAEGFARENGFRVLRVSLPHPDRFSALAYRAYRAAGAREGLAILDCFTTMDARFSKETGIAPLHLVFNTRDSFDFALGLLREESLRKVFLLLHPSYAAPEDLVLPGEWERALTELGLEIEWVSDPRFLPDDPYHAFRAAGRLAALSREYRLPTPLSLPVEELESLLP